MSDSRQPRSQPPGTQTQPQPRPAAANRRGDQTPGILQRLWLHHSRAFLFSGSRLAGHPFSSLLTAMVIGITLALPAALHVLVQNFDHLSFSWERSVQVSLFLKDEVSVEQGQALSGEITRRPDVGAAAYISRDQALKEFRSLSGFGEALDLLEENPLPAVISVQPAKATGTGEIRQLVTELRNLEGVESARMDQAWLERLNAIIGIVEQIVQVVAVLLAVAVVVTVGNTIRLDIQNRKAEIEVMKLLGATNAFVRRPFLYTGVWYGIGGGIVAWLLLQVLLSTLAGPVSYLSGLYQSDFSLSGLGLEATVLLLVAGILLGWFGSWWTVTRHLYAIEPK